MRRRITNREMGDYAATLLEFDNSKASAFARWNGRGTLYTVWSYGHHFPMYAYDPRTGRWFGNRDKYSRTTTNHQRRAMPCRQESIEWHDTLWMMELVRTGGVVERARWILERSLERKAA